MRHAWIMHFETFEKTVGRDAELADAMFGATCYVTDEGPSYTTRRVPSLYVRDYEVIGQRIDEGRIHAGENVVWAIENASGLDDPGSKQTPVEQQKNLAHYLPLAADLCHRVGATLIAAPAGSVIDTIDPDAEDRTQAMLDARIPAMCATYADGYNIQAQQRLQFPSNFAKYVRVLSDQARAARPETPIFAGLTTNSSQSKPDDYPTAREIAFAADAVRATVQGYWMNVPPHRETGERDYAKARRALKRFYGLEV